MQVFHTMIILMVVVFFSSGYEKGQFWKRKCGDGKCQRMERVRNNCPEDCNSDYRNDDVSLYDLNKKSQDSTLASPGSGIEFSFRVLKTPHAIHSSWSPDGTQLVLEQVEADLFYDLKIINLEGMTLKHLTRGKKGINQRNNGWPEWHPDGTYIVFQSEEPKHYAMDDKWLTHPGNGFFMNLWATTTDGDKFWKLTNIKHKIKLRDGKVAQSIVSPDFNHDGTKLMWTERYADGGKFARWGFWEIKMADFVVNNGVPSLQKIRTIIRAEDICDDCNYIVNMGFSPDGKKILVAGNLDGQHEYGMDNYIFDLETKKFVNIQNTPKYWEEGACWSHDGKYVVYPTNIDSPYKIDFDNPEGVRQLKTREWWIVDVSDGTPKDHKRLTSFNVAGSREYKNYGRGKLVIVAECSFSPDDSKLSGIVGKGALADGYNTLSVGLIEFK